jgi:tetratricopeptide (TPR) repeat protein
MQKLIVLALFMTLLDGITLAKTPPAVHDDPDAAAAKKHFERGVAHYNLSEYREAIVEFQDAYRLHPDPVFLYNLAQSYRLSDQLEQALKFYKAFLRSQPNASLRDEAETRISDLEQMIQKQKEQKQQQEQQQQQQQQATPMKSGASTSPAESSGASSNALVKEAPRKPAYKKWWVWTVVGVAAAGVAVGLGVGLTQGEHYRYNTYPSVPLGGGQ